MTGLNRRLSRGFDIIMARVGPLLSNHGVQSNRSPIRVLSGAAQFAKVLPANRMAGAFDTR